MDCLNLSHKLAYEYEIKPRQEAFFLVGSLNLNNSSGMFAFFSLVSPHFQNGTVQTEEVWNKASICCISWQKGFFLNPDLLLQQVVYLLLELVYFLFLRGEGKEFLFHFGLELHMELWRNNIFDIFVYSMNQLLLWCKNKDT